MSEQPSETRSEVLDKFTATIAGVASVEAAFGHSRTVGEHTIIPVAEVVCGMGTGAGGGTDATGAGGSGSGAGGGAAARPIATVVVGPDGVTVKPVYDVTKLWLAVLTTAAFVLPWLARLRAGVAADDQNPARGFSRWRRALR